MKFIMVLLLLFFYLAFTNLILFVSPDLLLAILVVILLHACTLYAILRPDLSLPHRDFVSRSGGWGGRKDGHKAKIDTKWGSDAHE